MPLAVLAHAIVLQRDLLGPFPWVNGAESIKDTSEYLAMQSLFEMERHMPCPIEKPGTRVELRR